MDGLFADAEMIGDLLDGDDGEASAGLFRAKDFTGLTANSFTAAA